MVQARIFSNANSPMSIRSRGDYFLRIFGGGLKDMIGNGNGSFVMGNLAHCA
jgi:hypothetical protein